MTLTSIRSSWSLAAAFAVTGFAATAREPAAPLQQDGHAEALVDGYLEPFLDTGNFSGSILVARRGEILFSKGYGFANVERQAPNGPRTSFYLASTSRIFTSAAILLLEQKGKLSTDDRLSEHLPDWPRGDEITIHHLLTLSAGFPNINELAGYVTWSRSPQTPASLCERFRDLPLEFEPGARPVHSNSNYNVLALLIERLSGQTYGEFLEQEFFEPLGMAHTAHDDHPDRVVDHRAQGYVPVGLAELRPDPRFNALDWSVKTGNGSIYSTTEDLYRFDRMLVAKSLLDEDSVAKLFTEHFPSHGYGWFVDATDVSIGGRSPGFGSSWQRSVEPDVTVIVLGNIYNGLPSTIASELLEMAVHREAPAPSPLRSDPPDPEVLAELVGSYRFGPDFYKANAVVSLHQEDGHLFDGSSWLIPAGDMTFIHRIYWSTLTFERDESGEIDRLQYDDFVGARVR